MRRLHIYLYILLRAEPVCVLQGNARSLAAGQSRTHIVFSLPASTIRLPWVRGQLKWVAWLAQLAVEADSRR